MSTGSRTGTLLLIGLFALGAVPAPLISVSPQPLSPVDPAASEQPGDDDPIEVTWQTLAGLNYMEGTYTDELKALKGKLVKIPGYTVPLEDWNTEASEFLLVPYVGACIHEPPPPPNQLVYVVMEDEQKAKMADWVPIWIEGTLEIEQYESVYGSVGYWLSGTKVYPY